MKKFVLLFITLSGINAVRAQNPVSDTRRDSVKADTNYLERSIIPVPLAPRERTAIRLFPNPAKYKTSLEIRGFEPGFIQVQFTNAAGNLVREDKRLVFSGNEVIVLMFSLQPGLYLLAVRQHKRMVSARLIIR